jgi:hypothetical protein
MSIACKCYNEYLSIICADEADVSDTCVPDPRLDSPSALTSGIVVCGNLTAALKSRRKRQDAWTEQDIPSDLEPRKYIPEASRKLENTSLLFYMSVGHTAFLCSAGKNTD